jgi:hypothetical protein
MSFGRPSTTILSTEGASRLTTKVRLHLSSPFRLSLADLRFRRRVQGVDDAIPQVYEDGEAAVD